MAKMGEYNLSELSDSRLLYMRNPPKFTYITVIAVVTILLGTLCWSATAVKAEEVQISGIVVSEGSEILVTEMSGTVTEICFEEGDEVESDDVLVVFDDSRIQAEMSKYVLTKEKYETRLGLINKMITELGKSSPTQPFENSGNEQEFYNMFRLFMLQYKKATDDEDKSSVRYQTLSSLYTERNVCQTEIDSAKSSIEWYELSLELCEMTAPCSGILHFDKEILTGTVLSSGTKIGSISSKDSSKYLETYITAQSRAKISVGQECRFTIDGLLQNEYGSVKGTVKTISSDAIISDSNVLFKVTIVFDGSSLTDSKGDAIDIVNGMTAGIWVVYEKVTYLKYFMDKLGIDV